MHTGILLPDNASAKYADRAALCNAVGIIEKARNAQLAREIEIALPQNSRGSKTFPLPASNYTAKAATLVLWYR